MQYYVSNSGNDSFNGLSPSTPLKTLSAVCAKALQPGDVINLRGGDVFRETLRPLQSGSFNNPITFTSYGSGKAVISGLDIVNTPWVNHLGSIQKTVLPASQVLGLGREQLFFNGDMMLYTIWPKLGKPLYANRVADFAQSTYGAMSSSPNANGYYTGTYRASGIDSSWSGKKVTFLPGKAWGGQIGDIVSNTVGEIQFSFVLNTFSSSYNPVAGNYFFLWGNLSALTLKSEYFLDVSSNTLYFWPPSDLLTSTVEIKTRDVAINLDSRYYIDLNNLNIKGAKISAKDASYVKVTDCKIEFPTFNLQLALDYAIDLSRSPNCVIDSCDVLYSAGDGIHFSGADCICRNNYIFNIGYNCLGGVGILGRLPALRLLVENNTVIRTGGDNISLNTPAGNCQYNRVINAGVWRMDVSGIGIGGLFTIGTGNMQGLHIHHNLSHDHFAVYDPSRSYWGSSGLRIDNGFPEGNSNLTLSCNVAWNTSNGNSFSIFPLLNTQTNYQNSQINIINNTGQGNLTLVVRSSASHIGTTVCNNIAAKVIDPQDANITYNHFAYSPLTNNATGDPLFISPNTIDFRLDVGSPCIRTGVSYPPYSLSSLDKGAYDANIFPFSAGANIKSSDVSTLSFRQSRDTINVTGMYGRGIGALGAFKLEVASGQYREAIYAYDVFDPNSGSVTTIIKFPTDLPQGVYSIFYSSNGSLVATSGTFTVGIQGTSLSSAIDTVSISTTLAIQGFGFDSNLYPKQTFKPITLQGTLIAYGSSTPSMLLLDLSSLIPYLDPQDPRLLITAPDGSVLPYWIDGTISSQTPVWLASKSYILPQSYDQKAQLYTITYSSAAPSSSLSSIFPLLVEATTWLRAHDIQGVEGQSIGSWLGIGNAIQSMPSRQPKLRLSVQNGFSALEFDGIDDYYQVTPSLTNPSSGSFFAFYRNPNPGLTASQRLWSASSPGSKDFTDGVQLLTAQDTSSISIAYPYGNISYTNASSKDLTNYHLGVRHTTLTNYLRSLVCEYIAFNKILTTSERIYYSDSYLKVKYGLLPTTLSISGGIQYPISVTVNNQAVSIISISSSSIETTVPPQLTYPAVIKVSTSDGSILSYTLDALPSTYKVCYLFYF